MFLRRSLSVLIIATASLSAIAKDRPAAAVCVTQPNAVDPGTPLSVTVIPAGFLQNKPLKYSYTSTGGIVVGNTTPTQINTAGMAPGGYVVSAVVADDGDAKKKLSASCQASFIIKEVPKHAPTLSVRIDPQTVKSGESAIIAAVGKSEDHRPLEYRCITTAGRIVGDGPLFTIETTGVSDSTVFVNCVVKDDQYLTADAKGLLRVIVPVPPPPMPVPAVYGMPLDFTQDHRRPTRVDNAAKGELDRFADFLMSDLSAKGVVVGYDTAGERKPKRHSRNVQSLAGQRAVNIKAYLVLDKGIDPSRIEVKSEVNGNEKKAILWKVPAGAIFADTATVAVNESLVKAERRKTHVASRKRSNVHAAKSGSKPRQGM